MRQVQAVSSAAVGIRYQRMTLVLVDGKLQAAPLDGGRINTEEVLAMLLIWQC